MTIPCAIFDIDGTLALIEHRRHWVTSKPKNWGAFNSQMHLDTPNQPIINIARKLFNSGMIVNVASGREGTPTSRKVTEKWLEENGISYANLWMRQAGDFRRDDIVKEEILDNILASGFYPEIIFDDRDQVVAMWRRRGFVCCQVAEGNF
ncbi:MAG: polynucleotide kinase [Candidatus Paceibacterota bacterium]